MYTLIVLNYHNTLAYMSGKCSEEDAKKAAHFWYNMTDSLGHHKYKVYISKEYKG